MSTGAPAPTVPAPTVLVLNCGSSSVKYRLLEPATGRVLARGLIERIGRPGSPRDHHEALRAVLEAFEAHGPNLAQAGLVAVGHRVVHGGERFRDPVVIDEDVLAAIEDLCVLAPLHNPANLTGIRVARQVLPDVPHVAVFDTAFHATLPPRAATYAVPREWRERHGVRRYGFHGTSHAYVARTAAQVLGLHADEVDLVVLHLGNGASACAVRRGVSVDTSMGLTPLAGLVMGTRSGDVDPAITAHLARVAAMAAPDVDHALNTAGGLLALAGVSDMREVCERAAAGDGGAELALDVFSYRVRCYIGAYLAALGRADAIVFTGGIGENNAEVRRRCIEGLDGFGISMDAQANASAVGLQAPGAAISPEGARIAVLVVPTDEEREIALQAIAAVSRPRDRLP